MMDEEAQLQAAEYALGTLPPGERVAFENRMAVDPELRAAVREWEERLAGLADRLPPVPPPTDVWHAIETRTDPLHLLRRSRARWRNAALAASAIAAGLVLFLAANQFRTPSATYLAVVNRGGTLPALIVAVDTRAGQVTVRTVAAEPPPDRSLELWYIAAGAVPRSLGLVDSPRRQLALPPAARGDLSGATLAVSVEAPGGSTTGAPTGPVIYSGTLVQE